MVADKPAGELTPKAMGQSVNLLLPENAIVVDEGATAGMDLFRGNGDSSAATTSMPHTGAAIGLPVALGAAIACRTTRCWCCRRTAVACTNRPVGMAHETAISPW